MLYALEGRYRLVVVTKGDLLDQQRKLEKSGLEDFFHHIEIVSEKNAAGYLKLLQHLDVGPGQFAMIGNSLKSDVLPVLGLGGYGIHVPYHTTWEHEHVDIQITDPNFVELAKIRDLLPYFPDNR